MSSNLTSTLKILKSKNEELQKLLEENLTIKTKILQLQEANQKLLQNDENFDIFKQEVSAKFSSLETKLNELINNGIKCRN